MSFSTLDFDSYQKAMEFSVVEKVFKKVENNKCQGPLELPYKNYKHLNLLLSRDGEMWGGVAAANLFYPI